MRGYQSAAWVTVLFVANAVLQRFAVPGLPVPVTVPLTLGWIAFGLSRGVLVVDRRRLALWLLATGVSGLVIIPQVLFDDAPRVSPLSWVYWMVLWLPVAVFLRDRSPVQYAVTSRWVAYVGVGLSALSLLFVGVQLAGVGYRDYLASWFPASVLTQGYVIAYPIAYLSPIYKSNAWIMLEPSFLSYTLGICAVCAVLARMRTVVLLVIVAGLVSTTAGSGFFVLGVSVVVLALTGRARLLARYLPAGLVGAALLAFTTFGQSIISRVGEGGSSGSSTSLRAVQPYAYLWPHWVDDPAAVLFGHGAGSSNALVLGAGIQGLLVPSIAKVVFDYGLVVGMVLIVLMVSLYFRSPEPALAVALMLSLFTLQSASPPLVLCSVAMVSLWCPQPRRPPSQPQVHPELEPAHAA